MHHLVPNSVFYLACFVMLCEAYLGFWPFTSFFHYFFYFHAQMHGTVSYSCGGMVVYTRGDRLFLKMRFKESFKKWQRSFFYIRDIDLGQDWVDLRPFTNEPPTRVY
ncbi:hypothetical protein D1007_24838 [Hordeum vulgare]|nr:hypothetical protein D1007_24838 [Hordeum vulgare]